MPLFMISLVMSPKISAYLLSNNLLITSVLAKLQINSMKKLLKIKLLTRNSNELIEKSKILLNKDVAADSVEYSQCTPRFENFVKLRSSDLVSSK